MELCVLRLWFQNTHQNIQNFFKWLKDEIINKKIWFWSRFYTATAIGGRVKLSNQAKTGRGIKEMNTSKIANNTYTSKSR